MRTGRHAARSSTIPRYSSRAIWQPSSTSTCRTVWPSGPVWTVTRPVSQQAGGRLVCLSAATDQLNAALLGVIFDRALAAAAGVDLSLDDAQRGPELLIGGAGLAGGSGYLTTGHRHAGIAQNLLGLVLVDLHARSPGWRQKQKADYRTACAAGSTWDAGQGLE